MNSESPVRPPIGKLLIVTLLLVVTFQFSWFGLSSVLGRHMQLARTLFEAVEKDDVPALTAALKEGADINARNTQGRTPLIRACQLDNDRQGTSAVVRVLLARGANSHLRGPDGETALEVAERGIQIWGGPHRVNGSLVQTLKTAGATE